jgi:hypothetical protein
MGLAITLVAGEPSQVAGVTAQLRGDTMIRVPAYREGEYDDPRCEVTNLSHDSTPGLIRVVKVRIR